MKISTNDFKFGIQDFFFIHPYMYIFIHIYIYKYLCFVHPRYLELIRLFLVC